MLDSQLHVTAKLHKRNLNYVTECFFFLIGPLFNQETMSTQQLHSKQTEEMHDTTYIGNKHSCNERAIYP